MIARDWLAVGDEHELYISQYGNLDGIPLLYLHGGPGAGCSFDELALFDLSVYHVIMMDQRGAGRSRPRGGLAHNSVNHLLTDIEQVREWLGIAKWALAGGSFGATLALLYAGLYPNRVSKQVLWGAFIPSEESIQWLYGQQGAARLFPSEHLAFSVAAAPSNQLDGLFSCYREGFDNTSASIRQHFVRCWLNWELALAYPGCLQVGENVIFSQALASIELYYVTHNYFGAFEQLSATVMDIQAETLIIQGELDRVCPSGFVHGFLQNKVNHQIKVMEVNGGYHALADVKMANAIVNAIREMALKINKGIRLR
ncbi:alpha/beta hydrolase [Shewanella gelidimarina]|uniref:alpha/beta fold hydrolase n=1 Tax=Shewanella gelidimarina TaxID=56813 RepID=UPI00200D0F8F|nr:alpha/beta fold hydrolase [Shewanella gelidimarina]MCL1058399.1 alpha/beta hydrolase [Shewanella gelidimarina]